MSISGWSWKRLWSGSAKNKNKQLRNMAMEEKEQKQKPAEEFMMKIVSVRFRSGGKLYNFDPGDINLKVGDLVIVQTENGLVCGMTAGGLQQVSLDYIKKPLKKVLRKVTDEDLITLRENRMLEQKARKYCYERIQSRDMQMKLVNVEYLFDCSKVIFYFTADGRIDFRELVKDLAARLRTRIEMRQIGVRDEAKMIGGYGTCGKEFCCKTFVREFEPVSIKMAKQQDLTLNPSKISGACGRLMCCLSYENASYSCFKKGLPKPGKTVMTPEGPAKVTAHNMIKESVTILTKAGKFVTLIEPQLNRLRKGLPVEEMPDKGPALGALPSEEEDKGALKTTPKPSRKKKIFKPELIKEEKKDEKREEPKEGLLSKIKKIAGVDKEEKGPEKKKRRRRRRRGRFRKKGSGSSSKDSDKKKES
jgi:cell fate regulator YaaT (PSP1 superfamily)